MLRTFLRAKLHRATITAADPDYEGSVSIDRALCRAAGLLEFEEISVYDISNGVRFTTYVIYGEPGQVQVNGAAAQLVNVGDRIIIAAYAALAPEEVTAHRVTVLQIGADNAITSQRDATVNPA
ncbi:aspartate decarboxylase [Cephaloticoccus primus]|uniref:Aspartate 1-decarboxylase n=1 Tax=Cephaloticoccus primus TaxID=1548207 RepID=A0A139SU28_9BACT|nr:aspartate 1-decarboxylase [Cephaloticoccus primus]KXU38099.1 aspartate decarboxylase [Cephaloticoccus primus]